MCIIDVWLILNCPICINTFNVDFSYSHAIWQY
jgi:hypothetical protein